MEIVAEKALRPFAQLSRAVKRAAESPSVENLHELRTLSRRVEAVVQALELEREPEFRALLKAVKPLRRGAGAVRDLDVLRERLAELPPSEASERLENYLRQRREEREQAFAAESAGLAKKAREALRRCEKQAGKRLAARAVTGQGAQSAAARLAEELARWPQLEAGNLHAFRIALKHLRYMLQIGARLDDDLLAAIDGAKDALGAWRDWEELERVAREALDGAADGALMAELAQCVAERFTAGLASAVALRREFLAKPAHKRKRQRRPPASPQPPS